MKNNIKNLKFLELKELAIDDFEQLTNLILKENPEALLASLSSRNIKIYIKKVIESDNLNLFVLKKKNMIIAYAIIAIKINFLVSIFSNMKLSIFFDLITRLKFLKVLNMLFSYFQLDTIFLSKEKKKIIYKNCNLNLLAVKKNFQSINSPPLLIY